MGEPSCDKLIDLSSVQDNSVEEPHKVTTHKKEVISIVDIIPIKYFIDGEHDSGCR